MLQTFAPGDKLKKKVEEIEGFDMDRLLTRLDNMGVSHFQTMAQEMTRVRGSWLGSNELSADIQQCAPTRIISFAGAEPLDGRDHPNTVRLKELEEKVVEKGLKGLLLTPPYGHYYADDKRVYPFYEKAVQLDIPIYFHHSHMFGPPENCPLKYAQIWRLDEVTIDFPDLRFNAEHMGYPWTEELLAIMSRSPNVYTDIAMFIDPYKGPFNRTGRPLLLARNLAMAREYGVLDRVFYGSDYVGESIDEYINLLQRETAYIRKGLNDDMKALGYKPLTEEEMEGVLSENVKKLLRIEA
jgi:predicted TIM-barrel fold metal-dependent hydrolase